MQRVSDMLGKVIDSYRVQAVLGKGGMGVVYKAVDTSLDKVVALKVMNPMLSEDERFLGRFKAEAKALGRLHHPNIVSVFALRHVEQHLFIVMEYVKGANLADRIKQHGPMAWQDAVPIMQQTLRAIEYAHREDIIHRDIKPHNILLTPNGVAKMTDFGLAKIQAAHSDSVAATRTGFTGGTLYYMPPEQLEGLLHVDHRGDIYGLGMTYFEMLAGRTPFDKLSSEFAILKAIDAHDFPPLGQLKPDVPAPLGEIVMKAIERNLDDRYQSAGAMLAALEAWVARTTPGGRSPARTVTTPPGRPAAPVPPPPEKLRPARRTVLKSLKAALSREARPASPSDVKTVVTEAPLKPSQQHTISVAPPPPPVSDAPPSPGAVAGQALSPGERRPVWQRPLLLAGAGGIFLLLVGLVYLGTRSAEAPAGEPVAVDSTGEIAVEMASLSIETTPEEAVVFVDSQRVGTTPLLGHALSAGVKALHIEKPGFLSLDTVITLAADQAPAFSFALVQEAAPAPEEPTVTLLSVTSDPPEAQVWLEGQQVGQTPLTLKDLEPGTHALILRKRGFQDKNRSVTVVSGKTIRVAETLKALVAVLQVTVRPFGDIYVNEMLKAQRTSTPFSEEVSTGVYRVRVMHPEYGLWERQVTIDTSGTKAVLFNFDQEFEVAVTSEPERAEILVDGEPAGKRTPGVVRMRPGRRTIAVRRRGYVMEGAAQVLTLERNRTGQPLHFTLRAVQ